MLTSFNYIKKNTTNILYLLLAIWCVCAIYDWTLYGKVYPEIAHFVNRLSKIIRVLWVIFFLCHLDYKKRYIKQLLLVVLFIALCFISNKFTKNWYIFDIFFVPFFLSSLIDRDRMVKALLISFFIAVSSIFILHFLELLPEISISRDGNVRYALGFIHPNTLGFIVLFVCILYILKNRILNTWGYIFFLLCSLFCFFVPNSYTSSFLIILLLVMTFFANFLKKANLNNIQKKIIFCSCIIFLFSVVLLTYLIAYFEFCKNFIESLPGALWARFWMGKAAMEQYGLSLFGQSIYIDNSFTVDCVYFYVPISFGFVCSFLYLIMLVYSIKKSISDSNYELLAIFILMILYGISEVVVFSPLFMFVFLCAFIKSEQNISLIGEKNYLDENI